MTDLEINLKNLDWSILNQPNNSHMRDYFIEETKNKIYTKFFEVEENEVVFDIGASIGLFTYSILDKKPKEVHCFEPHPDLFKAMSNNLENESNVILNHGAFACTPEYNKPEIELDFINTFGNQNQTVPRVKFLDYIAQKNIEKIDFIKTDCEGGEWSIFTEENHEWICNNVRKISGEFHLEFKPEWVVRFILFRDMYLKNAKSVKAFMINGDFSISDHTDILWDNIFIIRNLKYINLSVEL